ncbi:glycoside hydrolase family 3 C-terminal domain-containing protein [Streptomyces sp. NPDC055400]
MRLAGLFAGCTSRAATAGDGELLPLRPAGTGAVAVVGPLADSADLHGTWGGPGAHRFPSVSVLDDIRAAAPDRKVTHVGGDVDEAVAAASAADLTVIVVGEESRLSGEACSRSDIGLPAGQEELIEAVAATGKPYAVVLFNGRPVALGAWPDTAPAVLEAWHPGIEASHAVADVLFGRVNPGGKLPVTLPRLVDQVPVYYNHENTGRPYDPQTPDEHFRSRSLDLPQGPRLPFGYGLSYTPFTLSEPGLRQETISTTALPE